MARLIGDPVDIAVNPASDDLYLPLRFSRGVAAVAQRVRIRMQFFRGEWFLDLDRGVPYLERAGVPAAEALLGQKFDAVKARNAYRDAITYLDSARRIPDPEVLGVPLLDVEFDSPTRTLRVTFQVTTIFGDTPVDTLVPGSTTA